MQIIAFDQLPVQAKKFLYDPNRKDRFQIAAKGLLPLPPEDMGKVLYYCLFFPDAAIRGFARQTLLNLPSKIFQGLVKNCAFGDILHLLARQYLETFLLRGTFQVDDADNLIQLVISKNISAETCAMLAEHCPDDRVLEQISMNQQMLLTHPEVFDALRRNPKTPQNIIERLAVFLKLEHLGREELSFKQVDQLLNEIATDLDTLIVQDQINLRKWFEEQTPAEVLAEEAKNFNPTEEVEEVDEETESNVLSKLAGMPVGKKIVLALKGNKLIRSFLLRDKAKVVRRAVLSNPKMTPQEVEVLAADKQTDIELITIVMRNKEWLKSYNLRRLLCYNPKTPINAALRFLTTLKSKDVLMIAKSKNVPHRVASGAKRTVLNAKG
jgi:hypothetical protein